MKNDTVFSDALEGLLAFLQSSIESMPCNNSFMTGIIAGRIGISEAVLYEACWQLVASGLIVPGESSLPVNNGRLTNYNFPKFFITEFGKRFLANRDGDTFATLDPIRYRHNFILHYPDATLTLSNYVYEAAASYRSGHILAATVLIGVAAEELLGNLYESLANHAEHETSGRPDEIAVLRNREKGSAQRFETFRKVFDRHKNGLSEKSLTTVSVYIYDGLFKMMKTSRDDVAHGRDYRVSRDIALVSLTSFIVATEYVKQLQDALTIHICA